MTPELDRLIHLWRLAEARRDSIAMVAVQSRVGRLTRAVTEGAVAHG
jgi:hypothetical protein